MRNPNRNIEDFKQARLILDSTDTNSGDEDGEIIKGYKGLFQVFIETYSSDVRWQQRVPERKSDTRRTIPARDWVTIKTFDAVGSDNVWLSKNFEYRCQTTTAGSVVFLDVQWEGIV